MEVFLTIIFTVLLIWLYWWLQSQVPKGKTGKQLLWEEDRRRYLDSLGSEFYDSVRMKEKKPLPENCPDKKKIM